MLPVRFPQIAPQPLVFEILAGQCNRRGRQIDPRDQRAALGKTREIGARAASNFEHPATGIATEIDEAKEVMEFLEVILVEIGEKARRSDRVGGNLEIVNVTVPVITYVDGRRRARR